MCRFTVPIIAILAIFGVAQQASATHFIRSPIVVTPFVPQTIIAAPFVQSYAVAPLVQQYVQPQYIQPQIQFQQQYVQPAQIQIQQQYVQPLRLQSQVYGAQIQAFHSAGLVSGPLAFAARLQAQRFVQRPTVIQQRTVIRGR